MDFSTRLTALIGAGLIVSGCASVSTHIVNTPSTRDVPADPAGGAATQDPTPNTQWHTVSRGETLSSIVRQYGSSISELVRLNQIEDPNVLTVGQRLRVPRLPGIGEWQWPVPGGTVVSNFGTPRKTHIHQGLDIGGRHGQPVIAMREGHVVYSGSSMRGYGKALIVDHGEGFTSLYAHNSSLLVRRGDHVTGGQLVARIGRTGNASGEHCHVEIRRHDVPVNPLLYINSNGAQQ